MRYRSVVWISVFTFLTAGAALADSTDVDTTAVDTIVTDTTVADTTTDSVTALSSWAPKEAAFDLKRVGSGFSVTLQASVPVTFRLLDARGRAVWSRTEKPVSGRVTLARTPETGGTLARGIYVLQARSAEGHVPLFARRLSLE